MTTTGSWPESVYAFADDADRGAVHHSELVAVLATMLDRFTTWRLSPYVTPRSRCLEVAAGAGSIAAWLAERAGEVTATDTDPIHVAAVAKACCLSATRTGYRTKAGLAFDGSRGTGHPMSRNRSSYRRANRRRWAMFPLRCCNWRCPERACSSLIRLKKSPGITGTNSPLLDDPTTRPALPRERKTFCARAVVRG